MRSLAFYAVFGLMPGYFNPDKPVHYPEDMHPDIKVAQLWQRFMQEELAETGEFVSAAVSKSRAVYPIASGCLPSGEVTVTVNGHLNSNFFPPLHIHEPHYTIEVQKHFRAYKQAVVRICERMKEELKQTTVSIGFYDLQDFVYLSSKE